MISDSPSPEVPNDSFSKTVLPQSVSQESITEPPLSGETSTLDRRNKRRAPPPPEMTKQTSLLGNVANDGPASSEITDLKTETESLDQLAASVSPKGKRKAPAAPNISKLVSSDISSPSGKRKGGKPPPIFVPPPPPDDPPPEETPATPIGPLSPEQSKYMMAYKLCYILCSIIYMEHSVFILLHCGLVLEGSHINQEATIPNQSKLYPISM